ncbi:hypothetical protein GCM10025867_51120 (plasmid) [Frondihabitans sucicola]|uniref:PKD domain-containing protein n=1 Tax=Frondihabitans sucicola TaxID=1268041 RepID=A0ABM8GV87_9MICO|nr:PKD domain-containing protein [Frondihabitans sucicola]BDZ52304.1 hypothetical protein GCM10025867_45450 [Frondihabitans sucicola]BDZ52871.1 hypothetical protein GCM10025867_51120 [Frondihabitans sucicola]
MTTQKTRQPIRVAAAVTAITLASAGLALTGAATAHADETPVAPTTEQTPEATTPAVDPTSEPTAQDSTPAAVPTDEPAPAPTDSPSPEPTADPAPSSDPAPSGSPTPEPEPTESAPVADPAPEEPFVAPAPSFTAAVTDGLHVHVDATSTTPGSDPITNYEWTFGAAASISGGPVQDYTWPTGTRGTVTITLRVTSGGQVFTSTREVTVTTPPVSKFYVGEHSGLWVVFVASGDTDPNKYLSFWDFGDGSTHGGSIGKHAFAKAGTYTVTLTTQDIADPTVISVATQSITVKASAPADPGAGTGTGTGTGTGGGTGAGTPVKTPTPVVTIPVATPVSFSGTATSGVKPAAVREQALPESLPYTGSRDPHPAGFAALVSMLLGGGLLVAARRRGRKHSA